MRIHWLVALTISFTGCAKRTEVVVGVSTNLSLPTDVDSLVVDVRDTAGGTLVHQSLALGAAGLPSLPGSIGLSPRSDPAAEFIVEVTGSKSGKPLVVRKARLRFVDGRTLFLRLSLSSACSGQLDGACPADQWCQAGACRPIAVDASTLPDYVDGDEQRAQCGDDYLAYQLAPPPASDCPMGEVCIDDSCVVGVAPPDLAAVEAGVADSSVAFDSGALELASPMMDAALDATIDQAAADLVLPMMSDMISNDGQTLPDVLPPDTAIASMDLAVADLAVADSSVIADLRRPRDLSPVDAPPPSLFAGILFNDDDTPASVDEVPLIADFNGDGKLDVVAVGATGVGSNGMTSIMFGAGDGTFPTVVDAPPIPNSNVRDAVQGDFHGTGKPDVIVAGTGGSNPLLIFVNDGTGHLLSPAAVAPYPGLLAVAVAVADFDNNSKLDVVVLSSDTDGQARPLAYWMSGKGDGTFGAPGTVAFAPEGGTSYGNRLHAADMNHDGKMDLVTVDAARVQIVLGNGNGTFKPATTYPPGSGPSASVRGDFAVADLNNDGKLDVVLPSSTLDGMGGYAYTLVALLGNGDGTLAAAQVSPALPAPATNVVVADFNHDGNADAAMPISESTGVYGQLSVSLGNGDGTFAAPVTLVVGNQSTAALADVSGDGNPDVVLLDGYTLTVLLGM